MKRILINALQKEETRVAMVDGQQLYDLDIEVSSHEQKKASIYKGTITRVEPSLEAAFVNYGADRHGFLPFKEISRTYFTDEARNASGRPDIRTAIKEGQQVIVQVDKEERGNKGAALTTFISLAGRYLVLMPNNPRAGGVSRRIEGDDRKEIRDAMSGLEIPKGMGLIVRTAGVGRATEELQWDMDYQAQVWGAIEKAADARQAPFLIYQESNVIIRALRDYFRDDIGEILIDSPEVYKTAEDFVKQVMPNSQRKLKLYQDDIPMFNRYQIEGQIESAFQREVTLPSGGSIVVDLTEALISIDINSARATKGGDIEETATNTNLEAADEIARQLRLRDLGGLVVIDFIDMMANKNQRAVENRLRDALKMDRARVQIGRISRFGLLEMSRQRLRPSLGEATQKVCPQCNGYGTIRNIESLSLSLLRIAEEESLKEHTGRVIIKVPVEVATYIFNEKRKDLIEIENRTGVEISFIADKVMLLPHYEVSRLRKSEVGSVEGKTSYQLASETEEVYVPGRDSANSVEAEKPAVQSITPAQPAPVVEKKEEKPPGLLARLIKSLFGGAESEEKPKKPKQGNQQGNRNRNRNDRNRNSRGRRDGNRNDNKGRGQKQGNKQQNKQQQSRQQNKPSADKRDEQQNANRQNKNQQNRNQQNRNKNQRDDKQQSARPDSSKVDKDSTDQTVNQAASQQNEMPNSGQQDTQKDGSKRGNRRGRGRRRGGNRNDNRQQGDQQNSQQGDQQVSQQKTQQTTDQAPSVNKPVEKQADGNRAQQTGDKKPQQNPSANKSENNSPAPQSTQNVKQDVKTQESKPKPQNVKAEAAPAPAPASTPKQSKSAESKPVESKPAQAPVNNEVKSAPPKTVESAKPQSKPVHQKQSKPQADASKSAAKPWEFQGQKPAEKSQAKPEQKKPAQPAKSAAPAPANNKSSKPAEKSERKPWEF
ncbi:MAG: ribonuclease E/G [endosymbiont of Galathealinum brachiosum]|uniref:Ribonuclease E n=1 Tax=endosymbiont of Galathealinum brachiosum TaxID=2200906 RepID=A0A370DM66_9GAMM|nr:MAG: ribonuclease E/G [endosymbiont of Galathealinum brachiosum]